MNRIRIVQKIERVCMQIKRWAKKETLPMSLYTIRNESECRWPKNCPWIIDEYFRTNLRYLKLFFSEYVVWPFGMIPICLSSEPGGMWPTIYTWKRSEKKEMDERFAQEEEFLISIKKKKKMKMRIRKMKKDEMNLFRLKNVGWRFWAFCAISVISVCVCVD